MDDSTRNPDPRHFDMVLAFAGDSTITSALLIVCEKTFSISGQRIIRNWKKNSHNKSSLQRAFSLNYHHKFSDSKGRKPGKTSSLFQKTIVPLSRSLKKTEEFLVEMNDCMYLYLNYLHRFLLAMTALDFFRRPGCKKLFENPFPGLLKEERSG